MFRLPGAAAHARDVRHSPGGRRNEPAHEGGNARILFISLSQRFDFECEHNDG
ncbi:protein of unknown function [Burkholderia multivorans]